MPIGNPPERGATADSQDPGAHQSISLTVEPESPAGRAFPAGPMDTSLCAALDQAIIPNLTKAAQVMESRKSIRRWRGTSQPTRPGLTSGLFFAFLLTLLYLQDLSGVYSFDQLHASFPNVFPDQSGGIWLITFGLSVTSADPNQAIQTWDIVFQVLFALALLLLIYTVLKVQIYYRLWLGNWMLALFIIVSLAFRTSAEVDDFAPGSVVGSFLLAVIVFYVVYALVVMFLWYQVPDLQLRKGWFLPETWSHRVFPVPDVTKELIAQVYKVLGKEERIGSGVAAIKIRYSSFIGRWLPPSLRKMTNCVYTVTYSGEVDGNGLPHGLGEWNDTYYHGEVLLGWWEHGAPRGPFRSHEAGTGAGFKRLLIPYFRNRTDDLFQISKKIEHGPITCGIMEVECCTAGIFFREYPKVREYYAAEPSESLSQDIGKVIDRMLPMPESGTLGSVVIQADLLRGLLVSAHSAPEGTDPNSVVVELCDHSGKKLERTKTKIENFATVLANTYRHRPVEDSDDEDDGSLASPSGTNGAPLSPDVEHNDLRMAHMLVQPTVAVPGWRQSSYTQSNEALIFLPGFNSATSDSMKLLAQLLALGNFPSYLKPIIYSWPAGNLTGFAGAQTEGAESKQSSEDLKTFLLALRDYGITNIHFLTHSMGVRILTAALSTLEDVFVPANPLAESNSRPAPNRTMHLSTVLLLNPEVGRHEFVDCYARRLTDMCGCVSVYADAHDVALMGSELQNSICLLLSPDRRSPTVVEDLSKAPLQKQLQRQKKRKWEYSLGRVRKDLKYADGELVDVDVIQTTYLGANVQSVRHSAWSLNRELVDDLRDTVVNKQRAFQRGSRLQYRGGNRYNFLVAPTHVVNP